MSSGTQWSQHSERSGGQSVAGWGHRLNILDRLRWWLLHPGRIEFMLWLGGTVLLICLTCALLLVTAFSLEWISPGQQNTLALQNLANTSSTIPGPTLISLDHGPIVPGQTLHLHGQGFSAHAHIIFTYDTQQTALHQNIPGWAQPTAQADAHGDFALAFTLGNGPAWKPGQHLLIAHDLTTHHFATLAIILTAKKTLATPVVSPTVTISSTGNPGSSTPPTPQPPPAQPTAGITPTATPKPPTPTPTVAVTPTPKPSVTPTPTLTPVTDPTATSTKTTSTSSSSLALSASLIAGQDECDGKLQHCSLFNPGVVVWPLLLGYALALVLLVGAGVLRARRFHQ